jgi:GST-like protein
MACVGWASLWDRQGQDIGQFPHFARWLDTVMARPAVQRGLAVGKAEREKRDIATDKEAQKVLFGQKAR